MTPWLSYPRIPSAYHRSRGGVAPNLIVAHSMESPEKPGTARAVANWFAGRLGTPPIASAHFCIDGTETIQCVPLDEQGAHAPGANRRSVGIEHAGRASQTAAQWADADSRLILARSARLCAELLRELGIPLKRLDFAAVRAGEAGICGHHDVTKAFPDKGSHTDPGVNFPWSSYMAAVADELAKRDKSPPIAPEFDPATLPVIELTLPRTQGKFVVLLQERLRYHARIVTVDGAYGPKSAAALTDFQLGHGLPATGVCDAATWRMLLENGT